MIEFIGMVSGVQAGKLILNTGKLVHAKVKETLNKISVTAHVADEMNDVEAAKLKTSLESILGKTTDLDFVIDKKLMGGIKLRIDNIFLDASIQNKLNGLRSNLMQS
jgi:F0F1-type ATP synthase delta subunit